MGGADRLGKPVGAGVRLIHATAAVLFLGAAAAAIVAGGRIADHGTKIAISSEDIPSLDALGDAPTGDGSAETGEPVAETNQQPAAAVKEGSGQQPGEAAATPPSQQSGQPETSPPSRSIDPMTAPPPSDTGALQRIEPRAPLSKLSLALPPKPKMPDEWKGTPLYQPVAPAAGRIDAKGYSVAVSGIDIVAEDETCTDEAGKSWPCGLRARSAFRAFLGHRAVTCTVPPEGGRDLISADCRVGKVDIGRWLVSNGWARASASGRYAEAGNKARTEKKGIFGKAPDLGGLPPSPAPGSAPATVPATILDDTGVADPTAPDVRPPAGQVPGGDPTLRAFPPAPAQ